MYSPPFRELTDEESSRIINKINSTNPDFVWIGLRRIQKAYKKVL